MPSRTAVPRREPAAASRTWLFVACGAAAALAAGGAWFLWPREDKLGSVTAMQRELLAAGGVPTSAAIDGLIRTIDRMSRDELRAAFTAAGAEWKRIKQAAIDAYFAAAAADRPRLLDEHIARMVAYHDLLVAMNPGSAPGSPAYLPRERRRRDDPPPTPPADPKAEEARRELAERFDDALAAHAKSRGKELPEFR